MGMTPAMDESKALSGVTGSIVILLKHRPDVNEDMVGKFDLQLSGHTHGGQIFPWMLATKLAFPRYRGRYLLGGGSELYVSRGTRTWGPPMRIGAVAEITVITVGAKQED